jgi:DnaJ family protein C protein 28
MSENDNLQTEQPEEENDHLNDSAHHRYRMRYDWNNLIDDMIQEGQDKGVFDNLKGKGKPLNLSQNPYGAEFELAHSLLKDNQLTPAWIMNRNEISQGVEALRQEIKKVWTRHEREFRIITDRIHRDSLTLSWDDACLGWEKKIAELNKLIRDYNLKRPVSNLEILTLSLQRELDRVEARRWLK